MSKELQRLVEISKERVPRAFAYSTSLSKVNFKIDTSFSRQEQNINHASNPLKTCPKVISDKFLGISRFKYSICTRIDHMVADQSKIIPRLNILENE